MPSGFACVGCAGKKHRKISKMIARAIIVQSMAKDKSNVYAPQYSTTKCNMHAQRRRTKTQTGWVPPRYASAVERALMSSAFLLGVSTSGGCLSLAEDDAGGADCLHASNRQSTAKQYLLSKHALPGSSAVCVVLPPRTLLRAPPCCPLHPTCLRWVKSMGQSGTDTSQKKAKDASHKKNISSCKK